MKFILFLALILTCFTGFSQPNGGATQNDLQLNTITTALPFMAITPDSRAGGMGDAGTALSPSSSSVYWNTSILSFSEKKSEISLSYTPWLRQLTNDIHLSYLSGYYKINKQHAIGGALRYFSLGEITFTDASGNELRQDKPSEFELTGAYAFKLSDKLSIGVNGKFAYSNLTGGLTVAGVNTKPGVVGAAEALRSARVSGSAIRRNLVRTFSRSGAAVGRNGTGSSCGRRCGGIQRVRIVSEAVRIAQGAHPRALPTRTFPRCAIVPLRRGVRADLHHSSAE